MITETEINTNYRLTALERAVTDEIVALQLWIVSTKIPPGIRLGMEISLSKLRFALNTPAHGYKLKQ